MGISELTCHSYYLSDILNLIGIENAKVKSKINVGLSCWGLVSCTVLALVIPRFKRRPMYLLCATSLLIVYVAWTISVERFLSKHLSAAAISTMVWIFVYKPAYAIGYNALTYSKPLDYS